MTVDPGVTPDEPTPDSEVPGEDPAEGPVLPDGPNPDEDGGADA